METMGRGCLYLILGVIGIIVFVILTGSRIFLPWFILIPLVIFVFWLASKHSKK